ncbi:hypothetical protein CTAYLR_003654 [Chrysophaeum taylorii]|uniref:Uncharacterized protein n=1 Tax=Chrysophaeum taylorii TaxID=2483200 RepID=A0AAD7XL62_9STRA|nr:hypothetical protein CTAYLR_003654 [Chrysophaeum taylorii]
MYAVVVVLAWAAAKAVSPMTGRGTVTSERLTPRGRVCLHASARPVVPLRRAAALNDVPTTVALHERITGSISSSARWYDQQLKSAPLRTKCWTDGIVSALGDALAQSILTGTIDPQHVLAWYISGVLYF